MKERREGLRVLSRSEIVDFASQGDDCWERGKSERKQVVHGCVGNGIFEGTVGREGAGIGGFFWSWSHTGFFLAKYARTHAPCRGAAHPYMARECARILLTFISLNLFSSPPPPPPLD